jgi:hypothetical protein
MYEPGITDPKSLSVASLIIYVLAQPPTILVGQLAGQFANWPAEPPTFGLAVGPAEPPTCQGAG